MPHAPLRCWSCPLKGAATPRHTRHPPHSLTAVHREKHREACSCKLHQRTSPCLIFALLPPLPARQLQPDPSTRPPPTVNPSLSVPRQPPATAFIIEHRTSNLFRNPTCKCVARPASRASAPSPQMTRRQCRSSSRTFPARPVSRTPLFRRSERARQRRHAKRHTCND
jgi:hypothetical protein